MFIILINDCIRNLFVCTIILNMTGQEYYIKEQKGFNDK